MYKKIFILSIIFMSYGCNAFSESEIFRDNYEYDLLRTSSEVEFKVSAYKYRGKPIRLTVLGKLEEKEEVKDSFDLLPPIIDCQISGSPVSKMQSNVLLKSGHLLASNSKGNWKRITADYTVDTGVDSIVFSCELLYPDGAKRAYIKEIVLKELF